MCLSVIVSTTSSVSGITWFLSDDCVCSLFIGKLLDSLPSLATFSPSLFSYVARKPLVCSGDGVDGVGLSSITITDLSFHLIYLLFHLKSLWSHQPSHPFYDILYMSLKPRNFLVTIHPLSQLPPNKINFSYSIIKYRYNIFIVLHYIYICISIPTRILSLCFSIDCVLTT